jgi:hypothetical protein
LRTEFYQFLQGLLKLHPELKESKVYLASHNYGGNMIP